MGTYWSLPVASFWWILLSFVISICRKNEEQVYLNMFLLTGNKDTILYLLMWHVTWDNTQTTYPRLCGCLASSLRSGFMSLYSSYFHRCYESLCYGSLCSCVCVSLFVRLGTFNVAFHAVNAQRTVTRTKRKKSSLSNVALENKAYICCFFQVWKTSIGNFNFVLNIYYLNIVAYYIYIIIYI